jgi:hypothetical protein
MNVLGWCNANTKEIDNMSKHNQVTTEDYEILNKEDDVTLAQWWCMLNRWDWPEELPNKDLTHRDKGYKTGGRRSQLMNIIENRVGKRLISWQWNKNDMTNEEFNDFYAGTYCGDKEAKSRHEKRDFEKYESTTN